MFNENEAAEDIFFIQKGEVKLSKRIIEGEPDRVNKQRVSKNNFVQLGIIGPNQYFGEFELLNKIDIW